MQRCNWCNNPIKDGPFANYCSKRCENDAVAKGEKKGVSKTSGIGILILIVIIFLSIKSFTSDKKQPETESPTENNYLSPAIQKENSNGENKETNSNETEDIKGEVNSQEEATEPNIANESETNESETDVKQESDVQNNQQFTNEETAIGLLKEGKSVGDVANLTGLSRKEVRKLKRNLE